MSEEKNFEPSTKKKKKAVKDGQIPRSREITQAAQLTLCFLTIFYIPFWCHTFVDLQHKIHKNSVKSDININFEIWQNLFEISGLLVGSFCFALVSITILTECAQVGINFSFEKIKPKFSNIDPAGGFKKIFGSGGGGASPMKPVFEVFQLVLLGLTIVGILWWNSLSLIVKLANLELNNFENIFLVSKLILKNLCFYLIIISILFGLIKYYQSRRQIRKQLMMNFEELKREYKEDEGDPNTKSERKAIHHELLINGVMETVKRAKVIISDF